MEHAANQITIRGSLLELPRLSHENHGSQFFRFVLEVPRLSGAVDRLPVIARGDVLEQMDLSGGGMITVHGQIRSYNNRSGQGQRLVIFVFAQAISTGEQPPCNDAQLSGAICKPPVFRQTPLGREICDVMLAVPRSCRRSDYLPCILWGRTAQEIAKLSPGDAIRLTGRLQSRLYRKVTQTGQEIRTAYEVSALTAAAL